MENISVQSFTFIRTSRNLDVELGEIMGKEKDFLFFRGQNGFHLINMKKYIKLNFQFSWSINYSYNYMK